MTREEKLQVEWLKTNKPKVYDAKGDTVAPYSGTLLKQPTNGSEISSLDNVFQPQDPNCSDFGYNVASARGD